MGRNSTNTCNVAEDEKLAEKVRSYPCLYDKSCDGYKDGIRKGNAWKEINVALQLADASHKWDLLLSRYSRKRVKLRTASVSGAGSDDVEKAKRALEEYKFLSWLDDFIRPKSSKSNVSSTSIRNGQETLENQENDMSANTSLDSTAEPPPGTSQSTPNSKRKSKDDVFSDVSNFLKFKMNKVATVESAEDVFGKMVAAELKTFPENLRYLVKHDINQVIYNHKTRVLTPPPQPMHQSQQRNLFQEMTVTPSSDATLPQAVFNL